jgi:AcrR family transcriptional regulator
MPKISASSLAAHRAGMVDRLLDAFGELLTTKGYDGVSLAAVAGAAGLARTAIYNYFPDRESILVAWTDREVQRTIEATEAQLAHASSSTEKIRTFVRFQLEAFATAHLPPGQEVAQLLGPETYQRFMSHVAPLEGVLKDILAEGVASKEFLDVDPVTTVPMVLACMGAERVPLATKSHDLEEASERVTGFILRALGAKARKSGR